MGYVQLPSERTSFPPRNGPRGQVSTEQLDIRGRPPGVRTRRRPLGPKNLEARAAEAIAPYQPYFEDELSVREWLLEHIPTTSGAAAYVRSLFPFTGWVSRYNLRWLMGDAIGGITLGFVVVPKTMAYALLAQLTPEYGLYTSFVGTAIYWLFGTSKDIAIGATAVVSLLVGRIVARVTEEHPGEFANEDIARTVSLLAGACLLAFGLLRLDWVVEFIPHVAISAFVTSASLTIGLSQLPIVLGITGVDSRASAFRVLVSLLGKLGDVQVDAAVGLSALVALELIKWYCGVMAARQRHRQRFWDLLSSLRMTLIILVYTLISFLVNRGLPLEEVRFRILGPVPTGFTNVGIPNLDPKLVSAAAPDLPALLIVLVIEHIAIGKSFAGINNYVVVPSQEIISVGCANFLGPFLGAYPSTGSFTGTAILSKAGVRTPLAGVFTSLLVMLALYALTVVFYFIPMAALSGLIVHAVGDLVTRPSQVYQFWLISPPDVFVYFAGVLVSFFNSLEAGIYGTVGLSLVLLLFRVARAEGKFVGRVRVHQHRGRYVDNTGRLQPQTARGDHSGLREAFVPFDRSDGSNPDVLVESAYRGVFIYRFREGFNYLNHAVVIDRLLARIMAETRPTRDIEYGTPGDRPWNDPGPKALRRSEAVGLVAGADLPSLRAVVLDMSAVGAVDVTCVQALADLRDQLDRWASPGRVEWHLAGIGSRWTRRALAAVGFGFSASLGAWRAQFSVAELEVPLPGDSAIGMNGDSEDDEQDNGFVAGGADVEAAHLPVSSSSSATSKLPQQEAGGAQAEGKRSLDEKVSPDLFAPLYGIDRPFFHVDLPTAVHCAVEGASRGEMLEEMEA